MVKGKKGLGYVFDGGYFVEVIKGWGEFILFLFVVWFFLENLLLWIKCFWGLFWILWLIGVLG